VASEQTIAPPRSMTADASAMTRARGLARRHGPLLAVLVVSAALNTVELSQNGYANTFYSAAARSMLDSLHNFLFNSFDPGGLITVDKPPLALWAQVASARVLGFSGLSLLLPQAVEGVLAVAALYWAMVQPFGRRAALAGALTLAVFPSFVAVARDNNPDALLILLMTLACGTALRAIDSGRLRTLAWCGVLVGLAFNTKSLAAYMVVPGIGLGYLACAPGSLLIRVRSLAIGGLVALAVSVAWMTLVDVTPASQRPYVGGSLDNSELSLAFEYNGLGRIEGQEGAHNAIPYRAGAAVLSVPPPIVIEKATGGSAAPTIPTLDGGLTTGQGSWSGAVGPLRLLDSELGRQGGWLVPFALVSLLALLLANLGTLRGRGSPGPDGHRGRRDRRLAGVLVLGGWFAVEALVLSLAGGIVHPYYVSALGPGCAAMCGAGAAVFVGLADRRRRLAQLGLVAILATIAGQTVLLERDHYLQWMPPLLGAFAVGASLAILAPAVRTRWSRSLAHRHRNWAVALILGPLLVAPATYAVNTWLAPVDGTFPAAGPHAPAGPGDLGLEGEDPRVFRSLAAYLAARPTTKRFSVLTVSSVTAAPLILLGQTAAAVGGYGGTDPALNGRTLARLVQRREARYVLLGGGYSERGGNGATAAVLDACPQVPTGAWGGPPFGQYSFVLFDCRGHAAALRATES
jgi:4-amino-4-deoxy-L-arabinose transferase-like glycosyltransferase